MFAYIEGVLVSKAISSVVLDVQGIGYELAVSINTFERLPEIDQKTKLLTHFQVREDAHILYGFLEEEERSLFRMITKVSGFGAKIAISVLSSMSPAEFVHLIEAQDKAALIRLPGIGAKSADRLIVELGDKVGKLSISRDNNSPPAATKNNNDAEAALIGLGYKTTEVNKALSRIDTTQDIASIIRQALQILSNR